MDGGDWAAWAKWLIPAAAWALRKIGCRKTLVALRDRSNIGILRTLHLQVVHPMRQLSALTEKRLPDQADAATQLAIRVCTECRMLMGQALELGPNELHCCLKVLIEPAAPGQLERVATWARSEPLDNRPVEIGKDNAHEIARNTVWSSLMGVSDGVTGWDPFSCFVCNDLPAAAAGGYFCCDRIDWQKYYHSALVFPIRYPLPIQSGQLTYVGFLAFDSPKVNAFVGLPDIFDYRTNPTGFREALENRTVFNLGGLMADVLGTCLYPNPDDLVSEELENAAA